MALLLAEVNGLSLTDFVARFGDVAEHSPWVAARAAEARPYQSRDTMHEAFVAAVAASPLDDRLALIRAHPDLAGRAAVAGTMADDSKKEQSSAGLDRLTPEEFARFQALNERYRDRFGFPFILAVKGATKDQILASFAERVDNDRDVEFARALAEIARIFRFRIEDRVAPADASPSEGP